MTKWPKCQLCGTLHNVFRCPHCWGYYCSECTEYAGVSDEEASCEHKQYIPIEGDNWKGLTPEEYQKLYIGEFID